MYKFLIAIAFLMMISGVACAQDNPCDDTDLDTPCTLPLDPNAGVMAVAGALGGAYFLRKKDQSPGPTS